MTKQDIEAVALELQRTTPLSRLNLAEARVVVEALLALDWPPKAAS